ncbi:hypothetical protein SRB5_14590 [Streptomyces sp. RB5]|uniref:Palmitoyl-CoA hydrolase n=1 Tax=Streptomyces smaragdinus TaxID=2585196 RepID=A0A7K0CF02_9ACTN|nr:acyl-CoA thioesterase/bile acid-CoA:amino acid N-acyltransferase family protein [Streptomyces smaragdinus]MQY11344.1 hypothetical protein [Streptomyces smaragdinus]
MRRSAVWGAAAAVALLLAAGCTGGDGHSTRAAIEVDKAEALADQPVRIRVTGLKAGEEVTATAKAVDYAGMWWTGRATVEADANGTVDLTRARPSDGTYRTVDGMGLFWSMRPQRGPTDESSYFSGRPEDKPSFRVRLDILAGDRRIATRTLTRTWLAGGVADDSLTVAEDSVNGKLYLPPADAPRRTPVLVLGGSEGGNWGIFDAALLASRGHPALALCYFGCKGRPDTLSRIDLEYFTEGIKLLGRRAGTGDKPVAVIGISRGTEAAQLLVHRYPSLVGDVVLNSPTRDTADGLPDGGPAWTDHGKPLSYSPIPLDRARGTVLAVAGMRDRVWPSFPAAKDIGRQHGAAGQKHRALLYPEAGHAVGDFPYTATAVTIKHPVYGQYQNLGGTAAANAKAREDSWPQILRLLSSEG